MSLRSICSCPARNVSARLLLSIMLGSYATIAGAIGIAGYVPLKTGNQWSFQSNTFATSTSSVGSPVTLTSGVVAIPVTTVRSDESGAAVTYNTVDGNGYRMFQEYLSSLFIDGYGNTSVTVTYSPAVVLAPAEVSVGGTYTSGGTATITYTNIGSATLSYSSNTQIVGFETVSNSSGSQSWSAVKVISSISVSGTVNGQFISENATNNIWLVDGIGEVMWSSPNESGVMETWKLTSTNVVPATTTTTTTTTTSTTTTTTLAGSGTTLDFVGGWNLVGKSSGGSLDVAAVFGNTDKLLTVWKWIAGGAKWAFYAPSLIGQALTDYATSRGYEVLATIDGGEGFWVNAKTAFTAQLPAGTAITSTSFQTMGPGWNLIAVGDNQTPSQFNRLLSTTPPSPGVIPLNLTTLWAWDAAQSNWYFYAPSLEAGGGLASYIASKGYLDFTTASKSLGYGTGFWVNR